VALARRRLLTWERAASFAAGPAPVSGARHAALVNQVHTSKGWPKGADGGLEEEVAVKDNSGSLFAHGAALPRCFSCQTSSRASSMSAESSSSVMPL